MYADGGLVGGYDALCALLGPAPADAAPEKRRRSLLSLLPKQESKEPKEATAAVSYE